MMHSCDYLKVAIVGINDFGRRTVGELFRGRGPMEHFIFLYVAEKDEVTAFVISSTGERTEYSWEQICESIDMVIVVSDFSAPMETKIACRLVVSVKSRCSGLCFGFFTRRPVDETNLRKAFDAIFFYPEKTAISVRQWFFSGIRGIAMALGPGLMAGIDLMDMRELFRDYREGHVGICETILPAQSSEAAFVHAAEKAIESIPRQPRRWMAVFLGLRFTI